MATLVRQVHLPHIAATEWTRESVMPAAWLFLRVALGIEWIRAGWEKIGDPGWTASPVGGAVDGFLRGAIAKSTTGDHPEVQSWFANLADRVFLPNSNILAYLVAYGELLVGIALIAGVLTRLSVLFGVTMNLAFLFAGTTSTNPQMLILGLGIAAFGTTAGIYGLDRWLLPWLKTRVRIDIAGMAKAGAFLAVMAIAAWLAWTMTDVRTWLFAAVIALTAMALLHRHATTTK
ncbi:MAG TPA: DoxX family membrane protein [Dehalococcoidia bacterium]|nr:DoxX family membrane protein [Dehalococcoidia bacterium]